MEIVVIGCRGFPEVSGGIEKHCEELYSRIAGRTSCQILVLTIAKYQKYNSWKGIRFKNILTIGTSYVEKVLYGLLSTLYVCWKRPDIVHYQGLNCAIFIPLAKCFGLKVIYTQHSRDYLYPKWGKVAKKILKLAEKNAMQADIVVAVSKTIAASLEREYSQNNIRFIANGVNFDSFAVGSGLDEEFFTRYGLNRKKFILFVGRITPEKGIEILLKAYELSKIDHKLVIVGEFNKDDTYANKILKECAGSENIVITGSLYRDDLFALYVHCGLFVLPSFFEGLPIVLLEAISCGCQILASDISANKELDIGSEYYFPKGNVAILSQKLKVFSGKPLASGEHERRLAKLKDSYDWNMISEKIIDSYTSLNYADNGGFNVQ